jgi:hypothetical protein
VNTHHAFVSQNLKSFVAFLLAFVATPVCLGQTGGGGLAGPNLGYRSPDARLYPTIDGPPRPIDPRAKKPDDGGPKPEPKSDPKPEPKTPLVRIDLGFNDFTTHDGTCPPGSNQVSIETKVNFFWIYERKESYKVCRPDPYQPDARRRDGAEGGGAQQGERDRRGTVDRDNQMGRLVGGPADRMLDGLMPDRGRRGDLDRTIGDILSGCGPADQVLGGLMPGRGRRGDLDRTLGDMPGRGDLVREGRTDCRLGGLIFEPERVADRCHLNEAAKPESKADSGTLKQILEELSRDSR